MHAVLHGVTRDQMMARHKSNHIQVVYAPSEKEANRAVRVKAAMMAELGLVVHLCGDVDLEGGNAVESVPALGAKKAKQG